MLGFILFGAALLLIFWFIGIKPMNFWKNKGVKQGNPVWLFGDTWKAVLKLENFNDSFTRMYNNHPGERYCGVYQFSIPSLMIRDPDLIKQITVKDFDHFVDHNSILPEDIEPLLTKNLAALKGQRWREMRPILSPTFTSSKMRSMFILMSECVEDFVQFYLTKNEDLIEVDLKDAFTRFGNDVIASAAFGIKVDSLSQPNNEFYRMGKAAMNFGGFWKTMKVVAFLTMPKLFNALKIRLFDKNITDFFQNLIDETVKVREEQNIIRPDMIQLLMEAKKGNNKHEEDGVLDTGFATVKEANIGIADVTSKSKEITNTDIAAQALIFFLAGFETVTTMMSFMAYELALNPDVQDRLRQEIEDTKAMCGGKPNYETLMKMKYLDMVVSESLRKWPSAVATDRVCTKPYTIEQKLSTEKPLSLAQKTSLLIPIFAIHHDPIYYRDPEKFDPERFNEENKADIQPYTYLPFGLGPRNCIGSRFALLEVKILFFCLLSSFELVPTKKTTVPIRLAKSFQLIVDGGFNIGFRKIDKNK